MESADWLEQALGGTTKEAAPIQVANMTVLAIDPGPAQSAFVLWDGAKILNMGILPNETVLLSLPIIAQDLYAIEMVACYGMAVGKEVFNTVLWVGRFYERCPKPPILVYRMEVKMHHCHSVRANDSNIRQAILDRFGGKEAAIGKKAAPGPLYGVKADIWSALAIALFAFDTRWPAS